MSTACTGGVGGGVGGMTGASGLMMTTFDVVVRPPEYLKTLT